MTSAGHCRNPQAVPSKLPASCRSRAIFSAASRGGPRQWSSTEKSHRCRFGFPSAPSQDDSGCSPDGLRSGPSASLLRDDRHCSFGCDRIERSKDRPLVAEGFYMTTYFQLQSRVFAADPQALNAPKSFIHGSRHQLSNHPSQPSALSSKPSRILAPLSYPSSFFRVLSSFLWLPPSFRQLLTQSLPLSKGMIWVLPGRAGAVATLLFAARATSGGRPLRFCRDRRQPTLDTPEPPCYKANH